MPDGFTVAQYIELLRTWHTEIIKKEKMLMNGYRVYQTLFFIQTAIQNSCTIISTFLTSIMIGLASTGDSTTIMILSAIATGLGVINGIFSAINLVFKPQSTAVSAAMSSKQYGGLAKELIIEIRSYEVMFSDMTQAEASKFSSPDIGMHHRASSPSVPTLMGDDSRYVNQRDDDLEGALPDEEFHRNLNIDRFVDFETYKNRLLYYSTREQLISITEPGLLLIGYMGNKTVFDRTYITAIVPPKDLQFLANYVDTLPNSHEKRKLRRIVAKIFINTGVTDEKK